MHGWTSQIIELDLSHCVGLTDATGVILQSYATSITTLNIGNTAIGDEGIRSVLEGGPNLKHLRAQSCHSLTDSGLLHILKSIKKYKSLQLLDISGCKRCTDDGIMALLSGSDCLTELLLANSTQLSTCALLGLDRTPSMTTSLHQLNLQGMQFHDCAMEFITAGCKNLTTLNISTCTSLTDHALETLGHACLPLQDLDISGCTGFSDAGLGKFLKNSGKTLKRLIIDRCFQAADETISATGTCQGLCILSARDITRPTDSALRDLAGGGCKCLAEVNFSTLLNGIELTNSCHSPRFGTIGIQAIVAASSKQLVSLQIDGVFKVDDHVLRQLGTTCPALKTLSLKGLSLVTDTGMDALARGCQLLSHLTVSGCRQLTDKSVIYVARPLLLYLDIGGCKKITDVALLAIAPRSPSLTWLSVRGCYWLGDRGIIPLLKSCRKLTYLDVIGLVDLTTDALDWLPPTLIRGNFRSCLQINVNAVSMAAKKLPLAQVVADQPFCINPASLACRVYNSYHIEKNIKDRAALTIQICYHGMKRFQNIQKRQSTNLQMRHTIHCLQLSLNRICTRHAIEMLWENVLHHQHLIRSTAAAVQVQRIWRGFCGRRSRDAMVTHRDLATAWHSLSEGLRLERQARVKNRAANNIQQAVHMWLFRLEANRLSEARLKSSIVIQNVWRRHSDRKKALNIAKRQAQELERLLVIKKDSQIIISTWWRALQKRKLDILQHAVQENFRKTLLKKQFQAATNIQKAWKRFLATKQDFNACIIQIFVRKSIRKKKRVMASIIIQRKWRRHKMVIKEMRARLVSNFLNRHIRRRKKRSAAAVLQRAWRCYVAREKLKIRRIHRIHEIITRFQAIVRGMLVRSIIFPRILSQNKAGAIITSTLRVAASRSRFERTLRAKKIIALAHAESLQRADLLKKRREKRVLAILIGQTKEGAARVIQRQWRIRVQSLHEEARKRLEKEKAEQQAQMRLVTNTDSFNVVKRAGSTLWSLRRLIRTSAGASERRSVRQSRSNSSHNNRNSQTVSTWRSSLRDDTRCLSNSAYKSEYSVPKLDKEHLVEDLRALVVHSILKWQSQSIVQKGIGGAAWTVGEREKNEFSIQQQHNKSSKQPYMEVVATNMADPSSKYPVHLWLQFGSEQGVFTDLHVHHVPKYNSPASAKSRQQVAAHAGDHIVGHPKLPFELYCVQSWKVTGSRPEIDGIEMAFTREQEKSLLKKEFRSISGPLGTEFAVKSIWVHEKAQTKPPEALNHAIQYLEQFCWFTRRTQITMEKHALQLKDTVTLYQTFSKNARIRRKDGPCISSKQLFRCLGEPESVCWQWLLNTVGAKLESSIFWDEYLEIVFFFCMFDKNGLYRWVFSSLDHLNRKALGVSGFQDFVSAILIHEGVPPNFSQKCFDQFRRYAHEGALIDFPGFAAVLDACPRLALPIQRLQSSIGKQNLGYKFWFNKKKLFIQIREELGIRYVD